MYNIVKEAYERKLPLGELPTVFLELPKKEDCIRVIPPRRKSFAEIEFEKNKKLSLEMDINESLETDVNESLETNENDIDSEGNFSESLHFESEETPIVEEEKVETLSPSSELPQFDERYFNDMTKRILLKNSETHSLQCDMKLKFWVAETFLDEKFYYPHNLDFRGRAYPIPPNLNHLGMISTDF